MFKTHELDVPYFQLISENLEDGNAFVIMGRVAKALKRAGYSQEEIKRYIDEATSGDYNHLLAVTMKRVEVY